MIKLLQIFTNPAFLNLPFPFSIFETKYLRMDQVKSVEDSLWKIWSFSRPYHFPFKFFKGYLPQVLLGPFLNTLSHLLFWKKVIIWTYDVLLNLFQGLALKGVSNYAMVMLQNHSSLKFLEYCYYAVLMTLLR